MTTTQNSRPESPDGAGPLPTEAGQVTEKEARQVAEAARESAWDRPSFGKELFLGRFRLDLIDPWPRPDPAEVARADEFLGALAESVAAAVAAGPVRVDPEVGAFIEALDPDALSDADFDGLLLAAGLAGTDEQGDLALPERMAEVNAMLDLASPRMREALLIAFLDRLQRPVRPVRPTG